MSLFHQVSLLKASYLGSGVNHENQKFHGRIQFEPVAQGKGFQIQFQAVGTDGTTYHQETTLLGPALDGKPCLFVLSNNHPGVTPHPLKTSEQTVEGHRYIFGFGDVTDTQSFREEISLEIFHHGSVEYKYSWGLPGGEFQERSGVQMHPETKV
jgi:hypothetical protein